ncbi:hypothetical protein GA0111570_106153 [Raineyella antarctica]|uniref:DUF839 domain-containing protein n=1 Tax=Raineyella antarctica TaxID=1577474 RepID=A0A1G6H4D9_9ACTN|nr:hypothetical protein [Raineyella antarctica]SDB88948.1 hypothetical protein GA0111570_106153 [Raineyella antarctica]
MPNRKRWLAVAAVAAALPVVITTAAQAAPQTTTGPSSSQSPYLIPTAPGVTNESLLSVGDAVGADGYRMAGIPDGLGAYDNGDGTITLLMNHELGTTAGVTRTHGAKGSFVSQWVIDKKTHKVLSGSDLIQKLKLVDPKLGPAIARLCSADLPAKSAFYNAATGKGYDGRIFMNGEEDSKSGRAFAHVATGSEKGTSYEVAAMGNSSWENVLANPATGDKTVMIGTDDSTPGQLYMYVGDKKSEGDALVKAGLTGGTLFGLQANGATDKPMNEYDPVTKAGTVGFPMKGKLGAADLGDVSGLDTVGLEKLSDDNHVTEWWRPEDGAWDTKNPNVFYVNTTATFGGPSRTWKLTFNDVTDPAKGGTFEAILDGTEGQHMLDNMAAADNGKQLILNEDPGENDYQAKVYSYNLATDRKTTILQHDPSRFVPDSTFGVDEESSATIDVSKFFGQGYYLMTTQAHSSTRDGIDKDPALVEDGQLQLVRVPWTDNGTGTKGTK